MSDHLSTLGSRLRALREGAGLTQVELSDRIGISQRHISAMELGTALPSLAVADAMASALDVSLDELVRGASVEAQP